MSDINIGSLDICNLDPTKYSPITMVQVKGQDGQEHDFVCNFVREDGILPCSCRLEHAKGSIWYNTWKGWLRVRVSPSWWVYHITPPSWPSP